MPLVGKRSGAGRHDGKLRGTSGGGGLGKGMGGDDRQRVYDNVQEFSWGRESLRVDAAGGRDHEAELRAKKKETSERFG